MRKQILCPGCAKHWGRLTDNDRVHGFKIRLTQIPAVRRLEVTRTGRGTFFHLVDVKCDICALALNGKEATAVTTWRGVTDPDKWETEYGCQDQ